MTLSLNPTRSSDQSAASYVISEFALILAPGPNECRDLVMLQK